MTKRRRAATGITGRLVAAVVGGYVVTAIVQVSLAAALARVMRPSDAVWLATMVALPVFAGVAIAAFGTTWMSWLHTWSGIALGWVLFSMFVTGACGYYRHAITLWMTPELYPLARRPVLDVDAVRRAESWLRANAPAAEQWTVDLPDERSPALRVGWHQNQRDNPVTVLLDPRSGERLSPQPRETRGGDFLYRLHFDLHFVSPVLARYIVGLLCATGLLVAIVTGVIVRGDLFKDLFRIGRGGGRETWRDLHNLTGIVFLPYHLVVVYSGLVCLMILLFPWGVVAVYGTAGLGAFANESFPAPPPTTAPAGPTRLLPIADMVASATQHWNGAHVGSIAVDHAHDRRARVEITKAARGTLSYRKPALVFDGVDGRQIAALNETLSPVARLHGSVFGFHVAQFAGPFARFALFVLALGGAAMVATGLLLWSGKRDQRYARAPALRTPEPGGQRVVDGLNAGMICGLPLAIAGYLCANRLVPPSALDRSSTEISVFFWLWGGALVAGALTTRRWRWPLLLGSAGAALLSTPVVGLLTTSTGFVNAVWSSPAPVVCVNLFLGTIGAIFLVVGVLTNRRTRRTFRTTTPA